jgi:TRAP transporter TAXI family solute receptor
MKLLKILACVLTIPWLVGAANAQTVSLITTPAGSYSNSAGTAIVKILNDKAKVRAIIQAQAAAGTDAVERGTADFCLSNSFDTTFFATGTGDYKGQGPKKNIRQVADLIPYRVAMFVRADSDIKTMSDLKGKRISSGFNAQKTIGRIIAAHLANGGLTYNDVVKVPAPNVMRAAEDFTTGKVDVLFFALGSAKVKQASASVGGLRPLPVDTSPEAIKRMQAVLPGSYVTRVNPAPNLDAIKKPINVIAFDMVMSTSVKEPEDVVYKVTKALYENKKDLVAIFRPFALFSPKEMATPTQSVPFHPGALKFYKEVGLWPPKS